MIDQKQTSEIRRLFFAEHWRIGTIASFLGIHHDTVRRAIRVETFCPTARLPSFAAVETYKPFIKHVLDEHPKLRSTRLYAMIKDRGYQGSVVMLRRYVKTIRKVALAEAYLRLETLPAEQAQVDWAHFGKVQIGRAKRTLSCFALVLSYSRHLYARFFLDQSMENFLRGHLLAFDAIGGVPRSILYDNLKSVVIERSGDHIRFNPRILELAGHYHFAPKPCAPYRGNEKGKVERMIHYLRYSFFEGRIFRDLEQLNRELAAWLETTANLRPLATKQASVSVLFAQEKPLLLPLPQHPLTTDQVQPVRSGKTPYIRFDGNDYSIPHHLVGVNLTLVASEHVIRILDAQNEQVAIHSRSYDKGLTTEDRAHINALAATKRAAKELHHRDRLGRSCPSADALFKEAVVRDIPLARYSHALARLLDDYGAQELEAAIALAIKKGAIGYGSIAYLLEQRRHKHKQPPPLGPLHFEKESIAKLRVQTHSLDDYDALTPRTPDTQAKCNHENSEIRQDESL